MRITTSQIEVTLSPSKTLISAQLILFVILLLFVFAMPVLLWGRLVGSGLILLVAVKRWREWQASDEQVLRFVPSRDLCILDDGRQYSLAADQFVTGKLVILYLSPAAGKNFSLAIPADSMSEEQHRCLRQLLVARATAG